MRERGQTHVLCIEGPAFLDPEGGYLMQNFSLPNGHTPLRGGQSSGEPVGAEDPGEEAKICIADHQVSR